VGEIRKRPASGALMKSKTRKQSPLSLRSNILNAEEVTLIESASAEAANLIQDMINTLATANANSERTFQEILSLRGNSTQV
jgi:hypothetical protein